MSPCPRCSVSYAPGSICQLCPRSVPTERGTPLPLGTVVSCCIGVGSRRAVLDCGKSLKMGGLPGPFGGGVPGGGQEVQGPPSWSARGTIREFDLQNDLQKWKGRSGERPFLFLCPYYQDTKFGGKTGQNSLRLLWWKPWGIREKTLVPYAESLTSFPHLGVWGGGALFFWQTVRLQYASDFYPRMRDSRGTSLVPETPLDPVRGRSQNKQTVIRSGRGPVSGILFLFALSQAKVAASHQE
jgi:hypothetical protein